MEIRFEDKTFAFPDLPPGDHIARQIEKKRTFYEVDMLTALARRVPADGWAIDCGSNIGNHALFFAGVIGLRCIAFEPVARNRLILERLIEANDLIDQIEVRPEAVGDAPGEVVLTTPNEGNAGMFRIVEGIDAGERAAIVRLDDALPADRTPIRLLKIDVEGYETNVLRGAAGVISRDRPVIVAELANLTEYDRFREELEQHRYVAAEVHNATPTVVFAPEGRENGRSIRREIARFEKKHGVR
ncbi:FkbM family methyltransferase [Pontivivens ytuae]|uniref:FkbM family methyltransferase n=1 Tax=Pontivivens ytuae TaxID=2789856 RepID=A0A7S9QB69_9RHOB|nr:FkbM family methyltransferase [Pontivivens ytuae]QPH52863.1 FkbM family methyltransferase [Pontivivens ytuae]